MPCQDEGTSGAEPIRDELWTGKIHVAITGTVGGEGVLSP